MSLFGKIIPLFLPKDQVVKTNDIPMEVIDKIVCFSNTAIGDTLFNTPIFKKLKEKFPSKELVVVLNPSNYKLFETNPHIDKIILYDGKTKNFFQTLKKLRDINPSLVLILHSNEPQATPLAVLSGAKYILKIPNNKNPFKKWHSNNPLSLVPNSHAITNRLKFLDFLRIKYSKCERMELFIKKEWNKEVEDFFKNIKYKELIGFQIGASTISRMWFEEKWIELGEKILDKYPKAKIVLTGSPSEKELTKKVKEGINNDRVLDLAGYFGIGGAAALIDKLDILISPDTGPLHIATTLKTPTVGLFVVGNPIGTNACYDKEIHPYIQKDKTCTPCISKKCKYAKCMLQINPDEIITKIEGII